MPQATQDAGAYDVLFVADSRDLFGDYLPYNTKDARPVVGTQGLVASAWTPAFQDYSALQMQHRFVTATGRADAGAGLWRLAGGAGPWGKRAFAAMREMRPRCWRFWDRRNSMWRGSRGQSLTFRAWDHQLRQPVLLASPIMVVSMSPQEGFLSPDFLTDTLGVR